MGDWWETLGYICFILFLGVALAACVAAVFHIGS